MKRSTVVLVGPPGAGKSTVGRRLAADLPGWCFYAATGDMVRNLMAQDSPLAEQIRDYTLAGRLTPDDLICEMLRNYLEQINNSGKYLPSQILLVDGSPRTLPQCEMLKFDLNFLEVYHCDASDALARDRILVVRAAELRAAGKEPRIDDNPAAVDERLEGYHKLTEPTLGFYREHGVPITRFDMSPSKDQVYETVRAHFTSATLERLV